MVRLMTIKSVKHADLVGQEAFWRCTERKD